MTPASIAGVLVVLAVAIFLGADPLRISMGAGVRDFQPKIIPHPPIDSFPDFPRDRENKLAQAVSIKGRDKFNGPESMAFDPDGRPLSGVADGRVIRYEGLWHGWATFAWTAPNRTEICYPKNPDVANFAVEPICGRPLGIRFQKKTGELWIADAYLGIHKVDLKGGQAQVVVNEVDGVPMKFTNDVDFDDDGVLYFTDSSLKWPLNQARLLIMEGDNTGRLIKYEPTTKKTTVLLSNLTFANGLSVSKDGAFVVVVETIAGRLVRYWLKGEKAGTHETFAQLPSWVDNVRCNEAGDFWVALPSISRPRSQVFLNSRPWLRSLLVHLPLPQSLIWGLVAGTKAHGVVVRLDPQGQVKEVLEDQTGKVQGLNEATENDGKLYLGSTYFPDLAVYKLP